VYYDYPLAPQAVDAQDGIARVETPSLLLPDRFQRELARAQKLFEARRWAQARAGYEPILRAANGGEKELIALAPRGMRLLPGSLQRLEKSAPSRSWMVAGARRKRAIFHLAAVRGAGDSSTFVSLARGLVADHPDSDWAAETLNNLASYYIVDDRDGDADQVFRELLRRFPRHRYSERAAWKTGWFAYRSDSFSRCR
jgi:hypothetical protein